MGHEDMLGDRMWSMATAKTPAALHAKPHAVRVRTLTKALPSASYPISCAVKVLHSHAPSHLNPTLPPQRPTRLRLHPPPRYPPTWPQSAWGRAWPRCPPPACRTRHVPGCTRPPPSQPPSLVAAAAAVPVLVVRQLWAAPAVRRWGQGRQGQREPVGRMGRRRRRGFGSSNQAGRGRGTRGHDLGSNSKAA